MIRLIKLVIWIFVIFWGIFYWNYSSFIWSWLEKPVSVTIEDWDGFYTVFGKIYSEDLNYVKIFFKNNPEKIDFSLPKWTYTFSREDTIEMILEKLQKGTLPVQISLTTLPGWNIFDIDNYLAEKWLISKWEFIKEAKNISKYKDKYAFLENALTLEGFLYPDTHFALKDNFEVENYMNLLLKNFDNKIAQEYFQNLTGKQIIETINIASILEREERNLSEKATVAGILIKRYQEWWMIGADITACYAYELTEDECKMSVSKYIREKNEYNTRTKVWLPKTPINNPSINSIKAVLEPKQTPYYFYLHDTQTWEIYYAVTNDEHNKNRALYLR